MLQIHTCWPELNMQIVESKLMEMQGSFNKFIVEAFDHHHKWVRISSSLTKTYYIHVTLLPQFADVLYRTSNLATTCLRI